jgi:hypothetical protein
MYPCRHLPRFRNTCLYILYTFLPSSSYLPITSSEAITFGFHPQVISLEAFTFRALTKYFSFHPQVISLCSFHPWVFPSVTSSWGHFNLQLSFNSTTFINMYPPLSPPPPLPPGSLNLGQPLPAISLHLQLLPPPPPSTPIFDDSMYWSD